MANGITGGLESLLGLDTTAGADQLKQALAALQGVGVPTTQQLTLPELQKYVSAGVLSPEQYQAISENPDAYSQAIQQNQDNSGTDAQKSSIAGLNAIINSGGSTPIMQAELANNLAQTNQANKASTDAISENAQERGVGGGGLEFISKLLGEQDNATNANLGAVNAGANNAQLALNALTQKAQTGGQLQSELDQSAQAKAQAAQQIAQYNSQLQSAANEYNTATTNTAQATNLDKAQTIANSNTGLANERTQYNAQLPQTEFQDQIQKADAVAGNYGEQAKLAEQQATNQNNFTGNLIGTGATVLGGMYGGPAGAAAANKIAGGANGPPASANTNQYAPPGAYPDYSNSGYANGGIVEENKEAPSTNQIKAPTSGADAAGQLANHAPSALQDIVHGIGNFVKKSPITASVSPGHVNIGFRKKFADGGEVKDDKTWLERIAERMASNDPALTSDVKNTQMASNVENSSDTAHCYALGGEVHEHRLCMMAGGPVPGDSSDMPMGHDDESQDVVPANLSPDEIVLPRSVTQDPNAPQAAAQFVGGIKGQQPPSSFADVIKQLEANGLELRLTSSGGGM